VLVVGHHELDYPRNVVNQRLLRALGHELSLSHSLAPSGLREWALFWSALKKAGDADVLFLTEGAHRHAPWIKLAARLRGKRLIFDAFTSRYNTYVEDRRVYAPRSLQALRCWLLDWVAMRSVDAAVFDTAEHRDYFAERYGLPAGAHVIEIGADEAVFQPLPPPPPKSEGGHFEVLFYGTYIPLQGIEHIIGAAERLAQQGFHFSLIGRGQTRPEIERALARAALTNVTLLEPVPTTELAAHLARADVVLGIFGDSLKAGNVVPNTVVQAAASARAIVTRRSSAIERYFDHGRDAWLVEPADPEALARALFELKGNRERLLQLSANSRSVFERHFSEQALARKMAELLGTEAR
jgi:glycosyltransferase involved in cell wall biosynthesis